MNVAPGLMLAALTRGYGGPSRLGVGQIALPAPGDHDVLVRIIAAAVCRGDTFLQSGKPYLLRLTYGLSRPRALVPGQSFSGEVVTVGRSVEDLRPGDLVFGEIPSGAFAGYAAAMANLIALKPSHLSHAEAAALALSGVAAQQGLRDAGQLKAGDSVLVNGSSGSVGTLAVQIAKALGASVTAVCGTRHVELVRGLGSDAVIDYAHADFTRDTTRYDLVLDLVANCRLGDVRRILKPGGRYVAVAIPTGANIIGPIAWMMKLGVATATTGNKHAIFLAKPNRADLATLAHMANGGRLRPVIEHRFRLEDIARAYEHVGSGRSQGATVIEVGPC
jgi:NADPH:quinone reductase-like Zn-dependent oxidoreductase